MNLTGLSRIFFSAAIIIKLFIFYYKIYCKLISFCQNNVRCECKRGGDHTSQFDINIFVDTVIFVRLKYCGVSLCGGGRITANISPPYRTKIEYFIRKRDINNSYSRPVFSGQLKSFCRIDDISYAQKSSDTGSATCKNLRVCDEETGKILIVIRILPVDGTLTRFAFIRQLLYVYNLQNL